MPRVPPLVERRSRLIVFQTAYDTAVYYDLVVIEFPSDDSESVMLGVVVDVHLGEARAGAGGHPALEAVVVHHHGGAGAAYRLLTHFDPRPL